MDKIEERDIKHILEEAAKAVEGLPEELKVKAFELAFTHLTSSQINQENTPQQSPSNIPEPGSFFKKLEKETGIKEEQLKSIYRVDKNNQIKVVFPLNGTNAEKQRNLAYLYLFAVRIGFNNDWVSSLEFAQQTNEYGINDSHVSKNLKQDKEHIRQDGKKRGKEYSLTPNGMLKAKEMLKSSIN